MNLVEEDNNIDLSQLSKAELLVKCEELGLKGYKSKSKSELIKLIEHKLNLDNNEEINTPNLIETTNVLTLVEMPKSINIETIKNNIEKYIEPRKDFYKVKKRCPFIEDEFSEYFTELASSGEHIGSGHCAMDVKTCSNEGVDAMCVVMNGNFTNEKSLIQNFKTSGANLDNLFTEKKDNEAITLFMNDLKNKLINVKENKKLDNLYILSYISTNLNIYIACFKIDIDNIQYVNSGGFIKNKTEKENVNIQVNNFISPKIGKVNLYKSKKRVELRLSKSILDNENVVKVYSMK